MKENSMNATLAVVIFLAVIGGFVYISTNKDNAYSEEEAKITEEESVQNTQSEGVKITVLEEGGGEVASPGDTVAMNYTGKLADGTVFDSNVDAKFGHVEPLKFTLGGGQVIEGWDIGIDGMREGEKRVLEVESDYAYGANGYGPIPPYAALVFEVELLKIMK